VELFIFKHKEVNFTYSFISQIADGVGRIGYCLLQIEAVAQFIISTMKDTKRLVRMA